MSGWEVAKNNPDTNVSGNFLLMLDLYFGAVGLDDVGVLQLSHQIGFVGIDIDPAQLVPLHQFLIGQTHGLILGCQFVDSDR